MSKEGISRLGGRVGVDSQVGNRELERKVFKVMTIMTIEIYVLQ